MTLGNARRALAVAGLGLVLSIGPVLAAERPLLLEGTETIYQRVLTKPDQKLFDAPSGKALRALWPLQPVYVFEHQGDWLRVGRTERESEGWINAEGSVPWVHNIVGAFTQRGSSRPRQLVFDTEDKMLELLNNESALDLAARYREAAVVGSTEADSGVLTIEKEEFVDIKNSFYLMPITRFRERRVGYLNALHMEVASVPLDSVTSGLDDKPFTTGIVFVIDTTQSMGPFIKETLVAVREIVEEVRKDNKEDLISFGLVGFRDDPEGRPGTEYRVKEYVPLKPNAPADAIFDGLERMKAMDASTWGYEEDSIAGLKHAIQNTVWKSDDVDFAGRTIVLITDAPPKAPGDPHAASDANADTVKKEAQEAKVGIATMHILSRSGRRYHRPAEDAYTRLSGFQNIRDRMYFPVDARDPEGFKSRIRSVVAQIVRSITDDGDILKEEQDPEVDVAEVGLAMRLAYLGRQTGQDAPSILRGWTMDLSFETESIAIEPRVLLTRNQMLTMTEIMSGIIREAEEAARKDEQSYFFENVRDVVAGIGADGSRLVNEGADNLGGMIGEFLEYMPYVSKRPIMSVDEVRWRNDPGLRIDLTNDLKAKLDLYETLYRTRDYWSPLYDDQPEGEHVFALPLDYLP